MKELACGMVVIVALFSILAVGAMNSGRRYQSNVYSEGRAAFTDGASDAANPHVTYDGRREWLRGYIDAKNGKVEQP